MRMDCEGVQVPPTPAKEASYVSDGPRGIRPSAVHRQRERAVSSSLELVASLRVLRPATCLPARLPRGSWIEKRLPWGSSPSSRHQQMASTHCAGHPTLRYVPPWRFARPRRFAPPPALRVCFTPQPRPGFALQGIVPRAEPCRVSPARSCPPGVGRQSLRFDPRQLRRSRLQGFAPRGECGDERNLFRVPSAPRPSWASPPPGLHSTHRGNDFAFPPPTAFVHGEPAANGPRRIDSAGHG